LRIATYEHGGAQAVGIVEWGSILGLGRACPVQVTNTLATVAVLIARGGAMLDSGDVGCGSDQAGTQRGRIVEIRN